MSTPVVLTTPAEMRAWAEDRRRDGKRIGLVPTMGYLHEGHLSLMRIARARCDVLIATIFVNPTQFGPSEDLDRYPRDQDGDLAKAADVGVDAAYCPSAEAMYGKQYQTYIEVRKLSRPLCGASRAGHFEGVASVVAKLFNATMPHVAVFGEKDYQQLALIRRMVADLDFGIEIVGGPIVREADGLALSSRNSYLSAEERQQAPLIQRSLSAARAAFEAGETSARDLEARAIAGIAEAPLARIEYVEVRDADSLEPVTEVAAPAVLAAAVSFGKTRLIDNVVLTPGGR